MDFILAGGGSEEQLIDSLDFSALKPIANYITNRRSTQYYPQGQSTFSSTTGANVARITLGGSDGSWIDPSTLRICWNVKNTGTAGYIQPVAVSHCFVNRTVALFSRICMATVGFTRCSPGSSPVIGG